MANRSRKGGSKQKLTPNQIEYAKQVKRIKQTIKRAEKRGYYFDIDTILPSETPKRITKKMLEGLSSLKGKMLYDKGRYLVFETGETVSGLEGLKLEKEEATRKAAVTRANKQKNKRKKQQENEKYQPDGGENVYFNVYEDLVRKLAEPTSEYTVTRRGRTVKKWSEVYEAQVREKTTLLSLIKAVISDIGLSNLGWRLQRHADEVQDLSNVICYGGSDAQQILSASSKLATIIAGRVLSHEELADLVDQDEYNEGHEPYDED